MNHFILKQVSHIYILNIIYYRVAINCPSIYFIKLDTRWTIYVKVTAFHLWTHELPLSLVSYQWISFPEPTWTKDLFIKSTLTFYGFASNQNIAPVYCAPNYIKRVRSNHLSPNKHRNLTNISPIQNIQLLQICEKVQTDAY